MRILFFRSTCVNVSYFQKNRELTQISIIKCSNIALLGTTRIYWSDRVLSDKEEGKYKLFFLFSVRVNFANELFSRQRFCHAREQKDTCVISLIHSPAINDLSADNEIDGKN